MKKYQMSTRLFLLFLGFISFLSFGFLNPSTETLKYLQPGESREYTVDSGGSTPEFSIECDRLVPGQRIEYEADLK